MATWIISKRAGLLKDAVSQPKTLHNMTLTFKKKKRITGTSNGVSFSFSEREVIRSPKGRRGEISGVQTDRIGDGSHAASGKKKKSSTKREVPAQGASGVAHRSTYHISRGHLVEHGHEKKSSLRQKITGHGPQPLTS